ncbi:MAG: pyridoxal phosphate-dependent aminotransferase [Thermoplasmata archaeon]
MTRRRPKPARPSAPTAPGADSIERLVRARIRHHDYAISVLAGLARRRPGGVIGLDIAEPDLEIAPVVKRALVHAIRRIPGANRYSRIRGLPAFVRAVAKYYDRHFRVRVDAESQVLATVGSGEGLFVAFSALVDPGEELLLPNPTFANYEPILDILGGRARFVPTDPTFHLDLEAIERGVRRRTKGIVICHPNNPTGALYSRPELEGLLGIAERHGLMILSDENYAPLVYDGRPYHSMGSLSGARERTIIVSGLSKAHAMTGWRLGYVIAAPPLIEQFEKVAFEIRGSVNTAVQYAGAVALAQPRSTLTAVARHYDAHRHLLVNGLEAAGIPTPLPQGGFEVFPAVPKGYGDGRKFTEFLVDRAGVLAKPGEYFGPAGRRRFRLVFCVPRSAIEEGVRRIHRALRGS